MAKLEKLVPLILKWEGGYLNDPADLGSATNKGVTIATWRKQGYDKNGDGNIDVEDLKLINEKDVVERILGPHYWNRWQADKIDSQALANILVDWVWCSGRYGITIPQNVLSVPEDGIVGETTLRALNSYPNPEGLFNKIRQVRRAYLNMICLNRPANKRLLKGWLNRLNDFKWIPMSLLFCILLSCRTVQKTETVNAEQSTETLRTTSLQAERKEDANRTKHLLKDQNEILKTETVTAVFDTLDSKPILKKLQIKRTVSDQTIHADLQTKTLITGTETVNAEQSTDTLRTTYLRAELKEKPERNPIVWWIWGGAVVLILLLFAVGRKIIGN